jgi:hypothetical protein
MNGETNPCNESMLKEFNLNVILNCKDTIFSILQRMCWRNKRAIGLPIMDHTSIRADRVLPRREAYNGCSLD